MPCCSEGRHSLGMALLLKQCVLSVGMSAGTWLLSQLWKLLDHCLICLVLLWLLQPHLCPEGTHIPLPLVPSHADLLLAVVLLSHETLAALSSCFVLTFPNQGSWILSHPPQMKKQVHLLFCIIFSACPTAREHQHTSACTQMFLFRAGCWKRLRDGVS